MSIPATKTEIQTSSLTWSMSTCILRMLASRAMIFDRLASFSLVAAANFLKILGVTTKLWFWWNLLPYRKVHPAYARWRCAELSLSVHMYLLRIEVADSNIWRGTPRRSVDICSLAISMSSMFLRLKDSLTWKEVAVKMSTNVVFWTAFWNTCLHPLA